MRFIVRISIVVSILSLIIPIATPARAAGTITVNTTDGAALGVADGDCSLREAIEAAANNGSSTNGDCTGGDSSMTSIAFAIPQSDPGYVGGIFKISIPAVLSINTPLSIDGTSQAEYLGTPVIQIDGGGTVSFGLWFNSASDGSTIKGLMLTRFTGSALLLSGSDGAHVASNYIGTDGSQALGGSHGLFLEGSNNAVVGGVTSADRNVIAGNYYDIEINSGGSGNLIQGNYVGIYADGISAPASGSSYGVYIGPTCCSPGGSSNTIGGLGAGEGNVIAGHNVAEIYIYSTGTLLSDNNAVKGNSIGLYATGAAAPSVVAGDGIKIVNSDNTLIEGNVISGKTASGIDVEYDSGAANSPLPPDATLIRGNKIGTSADGTSAIGNGTGIFLSEATNSIVGGNGTLANRNLVSGNAYGIEVEGGSGNVVDTNVVGMNAALDAAIPNTNHGLYLGSDVQLSRNWVANSPTGIEVVGTGTLSSAADNCVAGNTSLGFMNSTASSVDFKNAWWGAANGPSNLGPPNGDAVSVNVVYTPFLAAAPAICSVQQLVNTSFETDANHDKKPDGWSYSKFDSSTDKRDCSTRKAGSCSLKLVGNGKTKTVRRTVVRSGIAGDDLAFSLWSKAAGVPTGSAYRLQVKFYNGTTMLSKKTMNFPVGTHGFKQVGGAFTAGATYTKIVYTITFKAASGTAWFDVAGLSWAP